MRWWGCGGRDRRKLLSLLCIIVHVGMSAPELGKGRSANTLLGSSAAFGRRYMMRTKFDCDTIIFDALDGSKVSHDGCLSND